MQQTLVVALWLRPILPVHLRLVVEAMTIAGFAIGAERGFIYVRGEYPLAIERLQNAIDAARARGLLGADVMGKGVRFDLEIMRGAGAYICGEETALFNSIEGFRGEPRSKPPFPVEHGLFGKPTCINNVETLACALEIIAYGAAAWTAIGTAGSPGTKLFCVAGCVEKPGLYEVPFGTRLDALGREIEEENPFAFTRSIRREPQLDEMMRLGTGPAKPQRQKNEKGDEYNERVRDRAAQSIRAMERIAGDPKQSTRSDEAKARIYSEGLSTDKRSPLNMERAEKVGAESAQTEREIEALRADAYEALRQLPAYQRLKDSDKERVRGLIDGRLKSYRGRAASSRAREKTARLPEFSPAELARTAMQGTSSRE